MSCPAACLRMFSEAWPVPQRPERVGLADGIRVVRELMGTGKHGDDFIGELDS